MCLYRPLAARDASRRQTQSNFTINAQCLQIGMRDASCKRMRSLGFDSLERSRAGASLASGASSWFLLGFRSDFGDGGLFFRVAPLLARAWGRRSRPYSAWPAQPCCDGKKHKGAMPAGARRRRHPPMMRVPYRRHQRRRRSRQNPRAQLRTGAARLFTAGRRRGHAQGLTSSG